MNSSVAPLHSAWISLMYIGILIHPGFGDTIMKNAFLRLPVRLFVLNEVASTYGVSGRYFGALVQ